jgi:hypothetical protein
MSMTYAQWVTAVAGYLPANIGNLASETPFVTGSRYNAVVDRAIEYAELRLYRDPDLDLLAVRETFGLSATQYNRSVTKPNGLIIVENVDCVLTNGNHVPLLRTTLPFLNMTWPIGTYFGQPQHYTQFDDYTIYLGPAPDQAYYIEFYGTSRPYPLNYANPSTILTQNFPDLFLAATMIFFSGYQKKFGSITASAPEGFTWETYFDKLREGAIAEEARKKFQTPGWGPDAPAPLATPPRG